MSLVAGIKLLLGVDPKESYKDQVAKVTQNNSHNVLRRKPWSDNRYRSS